MGNISAIVFFPRRLVFYCLMVRRFANSQVNVHAYKVTLKLLQVRDVLYLLQCGLELLILPILHQLHHDILYNDNIKKVQLTVCIFFPLPNFFTILFIFAE